MGSVSRVSDAVLARLAGRYRVLALGQLFDAGLSPEAIDYRVEQGRLQRLWTGVYLVGAAPPHPLSLAHGATASCGGDAYISHYWAAFVLGFGAAPALPVDIIVTRGSRRGRPGKVRAHRSTTLEPQDLTTRHGTPVTSAARTLLDIAPRASTDTLERLVSDAQIAKAVTERDLREILHRAGRHKGAAKLRAVTAEARHGFTRVKSERRLRRLLHDAGLPQPLTNYKLGRYEADFAWPAQRLIVEMDGFETHGHRRAFEHDRRRNAELTAAGWSVMQITWRQLLDEPIAVVARIAAALARRD